MEVPDIVIDLNEQNLERATQFVTHLDECGRKKLVDTVPDLVDQVKSRCPKYRLISGIKWTCQ